MNQFFDMLSKNFSDETITTDDFETALRDEEFLEGETLIQCFHCMHTEFKIIEGGENSFQYIYEQKKEKKSSFEKEHFTCELTTWLLLNGIHSDDYGKKLFENLKLLICKNCGNILGVYVENSWRYPYCGYMYFLTSSESKLDVNLLLNNLRENKKFLYNDINNKLKDNFCEIKNYNKHKFINNINNNFNSYDRLIKDINIKTKC